MTRLHALVLFLLASALLAPPILAVVYSNPVFIVAEILIFFIVFPMFLPILDDDGLHTGGFRFRLFPRSRLHLMENDLYHHKGKFHKQHTELVAYRMLAGELRDNGQHQEEAILRMEIDLLELACEETEAEIEAKEREMRSRKMLALTGGKR